MNAKYIALVDTDGLFVEVFPFKDNAPVLTEFVGSKLGSRVIDEADKDKLMAAYGRALIDDERARYTGHGTTSGLSGRFEVDFIKFPAASVAAMLLVEVVPPDADHKLTKRELRVLQLSSEDNTDADIARRLRIAKTTVSRHKQNIRNKLGKRDWAGAVAWAIRNGLFDN
mgnify:CR=1 FL=1